MTIVSIKTGQNNICLPRLSADDVAPCIFDNFSAPSICLSNLPLQALGGRSSRRSNTTPSASWRPSIGRSLFLLAGLSTTSASCLTAEAKLPCAFATSFSPCASVSAVCIDPSAPPRSALPPIDSCPTPHCHLRRLLGSVRFLGSVNSGQLASNRQGMPLLQICQAATHRIQRRCRLRPGLPQSSQAFHLLCQLLALARLVQAARWARLFGIPLHPIGTWLQWPALI